jgi:hypothetical protein
MSAVRRNSISEVTGRDIMDFLTVEQIPWAGRLEETAFLGRIWDLSEMRSNDHRFQDAAGDIWQHRVNNPQDDRAVLAGLGSWLAKYGGSAEAM